MNFSWKWLVIGMLVGSAIAQHVAIRHLSDRVATLETVN